MFPENKVLKKCVEWRALRLTSPMMYDQDSYPCDPNRCEIIPAGNGYAKGMGVYKLQVRVAVFLYSVLI